MSHALSNLRLFFSFFATLKYDIRIKERRGIERDKKKRIGMCLERDKDNILLKMSILQFANNMLLPEMENVASRKKWRKYVS